MRMRHSHHVKHANSLRVLLRLAIILLTLFNASAVFGQQKDGSEEKILNLDSIVRITYDNNPSIASARHKLKSAEYNFKLFESEFTQFIPLLLDSRVRNQSGNKTSAEVVASMEKEFFGGASLSLDVGNETDRRPGETAHTQFVAGRLEFPLFSSNRKLNRVIKRTFEENELFNANLDYVEAIREEISDAVESYYDLVSRTQILETGGKYQEKLNALLDEEWVKAHTADRQQIMDELRALDSDIKGWEVRVSSIRIQLQRQLGVASIEPFRVEPISLKPVPSEAEGLGEKDYLGKYYVEEDYTTILKKALANDTQIKVLRRVIENAREKKRLAEQGRWDIFASIGGRYENFSQDSERNYSIDIGLSIQKFDSEVLNYSRLKAEADILNTQARIRDTEFGLEARIQERKGEAENQRKQLQSLHESLQSRKDIYTFKLERYLKGEESIDNLIHAFRSLLNTEKELYEVGNDYFDNIRDLDNLCGVYFEKLGIQVK
jgi:outer membrane protein TolC